MSFELDYLSLVSKVHHYGAERVGRNGATYSMFGGQLRIDDLMEDRFPLLTTRRIFYSGVFGELAAFVRGATSVAEFKQWGCNYWDANAAAWRYNDGVPPDRHMVGQVYGAQWIDWNGNGYNQLEALIAGIKRDPFSRRHVITTFSPTAVACLPPCHLLAQYYISNDGLLSCHVYMRSVDLILGLPSDIVLYAAMLVQIAAETGLAPGELIFSFGDAHIYKNHISTFVNEQVHRDPLPAPKYQLRKAGLLDFTPESIEILDYKHQGAIKYDFSV